MINYLLDAMARLHDRQQEVTALARLDIRAGANELIQPPQRGVVILPAQMSAAPPANFGSDRQIVTVSFSAITYLPASVRPESNIASLEQTTAAVRAAFIGWTPNGASHANYYVGGELAQAPSAESPVVAWRDDFSYQTTIQGV